VIGQRATDRLHGLPQRGSESCLEVDLREEQMVGVVGREGEDADASASKRARDRFENADLGEIERATDAEAPEAPLRLRFPWDGSFGTDDGKLGQCG